MSRVRPASAAVERIDRFKNGVPVDDSLDQRLRILNGMALALQTSETQSLDRADTSRFVAGQDKAVKKKVASAAHVV